VSETNIEYPIPLRHGHEIRAIAKVRCPVDLTMEDVETINRFLKAVATDAPIPEGAEAW
jgi:hypothetical protein